MKILFILVKYNNQSKEAIMKKNDLAKTLSEYIKEDTNIKFDFSGEVSSTYSVPVSYTHLTLPTIITV